MLRVNIDEAIAQLFQVVQVNRRIVYECPRSRRSTITRDAISIPCRRTPNRAFRKTDEDCISKYRKRSRRYISFPLFNLAAIGALPQHQRQGT